MIPKLKLWQRLVIALLAMVIASFVVGVLWRSGFDAQVPSYFSGVVGGLAALGTWELLRRR